MSLRTALAFPEMSLRAANIATAQSQTCDWIFETPEYKRWLDPAFRPAHHGILWIKGKPGAGKSTIMKHILRTAQKNGGNGKIISFFFNARGQGLERSTEGMYRALLCQLVDGVPSLSDMVESELRPILEKQGWPLELLKDLFREAVLHYQYDGSLTCYVDALDECAEDEIHDMLELFEDLGTEELPWSVCFTSRYYPKITITHVEDIVIDNLCGHQDDISEYVQRRLKLPHVESTLKETLYTEIRHKSSGVFLWVVLVVGILNATSDRGKVHLLLNRLREIPPNLHALSEDIIGGDKADANFLPIMMWSLYAERPLKAAELYYAVMTSTGSLTPTTIQWNEDRVNEQVLRDFVTASSKGFLETFAPFASFARRPPFLISGRQTIVRVSSPANLSVQFIHESARQFFLDHGLKRLDTSLGNAVAETAEAIHQRLSRWCLSYMELTLAQHLSSTASPIASLSESVLNVGSLDSNPFLEYVLADGTSAHFLNGKERRNIDVWSYPTDTEGKDDFPSTILLPHRDCWRYGFHVYPRDQERRVRQVIFSHSFGAWLNKLCDYLLRHMLEDPNRTKLQSKHQTADGQITWDRVHVIRAIIVGVLSKAQNFSEPIHLRKSKCSTPITTLATRGPWALPRRIDEILTTAAEAEDDLVVQVDNALLARCETVLNIPLGRLCTLVRRTDPRVAHHVRETVVHALAHYIPQSQFGSSDYGDIVEAARCHYEKSGDSQLFRLLIGARQVASSRTIGWSRLDQLYEDGFEV